jgi:peptidylprolyl isomerase
MPRRGYETEGPDHLCRTLGAGQVIPGWDQGVAGMQVGGRRELIIPPNLAYGPQGSPPAIGKNATLIFVIDLLPIK